MKKIFISLAIFSTLTLGLAMLAPQTVSAVDDPSGASGGSSTSSGTSSTSSSGTSSAGSSNFFGLTPWNYGVNTQPTSEEELKNNIWLIVSNIATDIAVIAAYLVLGYVIYGGYMYIFSAGDPGKAAAGKKTLAQAFIGLAIVMSANLIMGTIRAVLVGGQFKDCANESCIGTGIMVENMISWFTGMAGVVAVIFLVYGGIQYITSAGEASKIENAKKMIIYSLIGLGIVALAIAITAFVSNMIRNAQTSNIVELIKIAKGIQ